VWWPAWKTAWTVRVVIREPVMLVLRTTMPGDLGGGGHSGHGGGLYKSNAVVAPYSLKPPGLNP
jgi:hypothetical protein